MSKCPKCGSEYYGIRADNYCLSCGYRGDKTVFHHITESLEVLAEKLVYLVSFSYNGAANYYWRSTIIDKAWKTKSEAIAATVARLKEVCNE